MAVTITLMLVASSSAFPDYASLLVTLSQIVIVILPYLTFLIDLPKFNSLTIFSSPALDCKLCKQGLFTKLIRIYLLANNR